MSESPQITEQGLQEAGLVERLLRGGSNALGYVAGAAILLMMLHVSADVLFKYLLNLPIVGTLEMVSQYYMVAVVFLPLAAIEFRREHILVELFTIRFGKRAVAALDSFSCLLAAVFSGCVTWMSAIEAYRRTLTFDLVDAVYYRIYVWPTRWFLTIGFGLFTLVLILHFFQFLRRARGKGPVPEKAGGDLDPTE